MAAVPAEALGRTDESSDAWTSLVDGQRVALREGFLCRSQFAGSN